MEPLLPKGASFTINRDSAVDITTSINTVKSNAVTGLVLAGIVVNNAIVLIDYIKILLEREIPLKEAILEAGRTRLRPIFMTTMTTVFGMIPLSLGIGQGSEIYKGMAIAAIFGLIFSTLLTLILIPILFYIYEVVKNKISKR